MEIKRNKSPESTLKMSTHTNKNWIFLEGKQANKKPIIVRRKQGNQNVFARNRKPFSPPSVSSPALSPVHFMSHWHWFSIVLSSFSLENPFSRLSSVHVFFISPRHMPVPVQLSQVIFLEVWSTLVVNRMCSFLISSLRVLRTSTVASSSHSPQFVLLVASL